MRKIPERVKLRGLFAPKESIEVGAVIDTGSNRIESKWVYGT